MRRALVSILFLCFTALAQASSDSLRISLLTCDGYDEVWALYGHSALRIQNTNRANADFAVNYGLFDFRQPFFPLKFALGHCDYLMGLVPFPIFLQEFTAKGAGVYEQELNLTPEEKSAVIAAIEINARPENCQYRYNFYYDNCASRPRNIVLDNIARKVEYTNKIDETRTFRQLIHECNENQRWCRVGNDLLLGVGSDRAANRTEQQFLPKNLMRDFASAQLVNKNGHKEPLVLHSQWVLPRAENAESENETAGFPIPPSGCAALLFIATLLITAWEWWKKKNLWLFDTILFAAAGTIGLLLFFMIFSEHPTVRLNLQILVFNPLIWIFWWRAVKSMKNSNGMCIKEGDRKTKLAIAIYSCLCLATITIGYCFQDFAEGFFFTTLAIYLRLLRRTKIFLPLRK